jgi:hypothetical protein
VGAVKSVKIDGEDLHIFNSSISIFEASAGNTLELDLIISEVAAKKYQNMNNYIIEAELENGIVLNEIMHGKVMHGRLPQLHLFNDIDDPSDYDGIPIVNENDSWFPNLEEGITLAEIRKVEMPIEEVSLKLKLPIDQVEWLKKQKKQKLNEWLIEVIYASWKNE